MKKGDLKFITPGDFLRLTSWKGYKLVKVANLKGYIPRAKELEERLGISFGYIDPTDSSDDVPFIYNSEAYIIYCFKGSPKLYTTGTNSRNSDKEELVTFLNNL